MKTTLALSILFLFVLISCKKSSEEEPVPPNYTKNTIAYKTITGVDPNLLSLDIYHYGPVKNSNPVVIYVHGGGWRIGDKVYQLQNKVSLFHSLGYLFISINYRLSPDPPELNNSNRIKFPTHNDDIASAVKWIYDNISAYNGDASKMALMGHSAGAHLVSLSGTSSVFLPGQGLNLNSIKGVASIDTDGYDVTEIMTTGTETFKNLYENAFGNNPVDWNSASPIAQPVMGVTYPSFFIAKRGSASRIANADAFINKLESVGTSVSQVNGSQYDHEGINNAIGKPGETVITEPLKRFLQKCFQ